MAPANAFSRMQFSPLQLLEVLDRNSLTKFFLELLFRSSLSKFSLEVLLRKLWKRANTLQTLFWVARFVCSSNRSFYRSSNWEALRSLNWSQRLQVAKLNLVAKNLEFHTLVLPTSVFSPLQNVPYLRVLLLLSERLWQSRETTEADLTAECGEKVRWMMQPLSKCETANCIPERLRRAREIDFTPVRPQMD